MTAKILPSPNVKAQVQPIADFLRIGDTGHRHLADLQAEGRRQAQRVVVDASRLRHQKEVVDAFRAAGAETVLDTKAAKLAVPAEFEGFASGAPWASSGNGEPLGPRYFNKRAPSDVIGQIARFAVEHQVHAVLAPGHFLDGQMARADRLARQVKELNAGEPNLMKRLVCHSRRTEKLRATLENLQETYGNDSPRSNPTRRRVAPHVVRRLSGV